MSRSSVLLCAAAFGLTLAAVAPAEATVRTATYAWMPATGPVAGYVLYASVDGGAEFLYGFVDAPSALLEVDSGSWLVVTVAAYDAIGRPGPRSDPAPPMRLCPGDFDGDEIIGLPDVFRARSCFGLLATDDCVPADMDDDGIVGIADFGALKLMLGTNACVGFPPFPPPQTQTQTPIEPLTLAGCAGDMNGDAQITTEDLEAARACLDLLPLGNCAYADLDSSGLITRDDTSIIRQAAEEGTCPQ